MSEYIEERDDAGFTLVELLIAIVVVGILTAVAIVGIAGLTNKGSDSACKATADAAKAASVVHYANTGSYPSTFSAMQAPVKELDVPSSVTPSGATLSTGSWMLTMTGGGATENTFTCGTPTTTTVP